MSQWIIVATFLLQGGAVAELPAAGRFDAVAGCLERHREMLAAWDRTIAREQALADRRCAGSFARDRCIDEEFRAAVPALLLGKPRCSEVPTQ